MGGISASIGHRKGEIGAIVDGAARDVDHSRDIGYGILSRRQPDHRQMAHRHEAINKLVTICGIRQSRRWVLADEVGVCHPARAGRGSSSACNRLPPTRNPEAKIVWRAGQRIDTIPR
jgi:regulator of RNase E activity RraA